MNIKTIDDLILNRLDELIELKTISYKATGKKDYDYWAEGFIKMTPKSFKIFNPILKTVNSNYLEQITGKKRTIKDRFFKDAIGNLAAIDYEFARMEYEKGLLEVYFASSLAGADQFAKKVGVVTSFSPADGIAIDHYKFLTEQRASYLIDTDKKILGNILKTSGTEGLTLRETKALITKKLSNVENIASRAHNIAVTETSTSVNWAQYNSGIKSPIKMLKTWFTTGDRRVRPGHSILDGVTIPMEKSFITGLGNLMAYPADDQGSSADIVGCRCSFGMYPA